MSFSCLCTVCGMASDPSNPHDMYLRNFLGRPDDAASELQLLLPKELAARLKWGAMKRVSATFVSKDMVDRQSDLLFQIPLDGRDAFIYLLLEHQSSNDRMMAFRMLEYVVGIWSNYLRENPKKKTLPPIIPVVVHVGPSGPVWSASLEVAELIDIAPDLRAMVSEYLPRMRYLLDDVKALDLKTLLARPLTPHARVVLVLVKTIGDLDVQKAHLPDLVPDLLAILAAQGGKQDFATTVKYLIDRGKLPIDILLSLLDGLGPEAKEVMVTTGEMLRAEGEARLLLKVLVSRFGPVSAAVERQV